NWNEISDNEAQQHRYRINGYRVESYWSLVDNAYLVSDGGAQDYFVNGSNLRVVGDQHDTVVNDTLVVDVNAQGGVALNLNGDALSFDANQITTLTINLGSGSNII